MIALNRKMTNVLVEMHRVKSKKAIEVLKEVQLYRERIEALNNER